MYLLSIPFIFLFTITIPDCASKKFENWYALSFFMSIVWIGVLCHIMVEFAVGIACIAEIDPIVMGVLVLAVGTSVPDAIGSMIAARNGEADMAIANAVGSNVFDVLLGLGFPWWLAIIIKGEDFLVCKDGIDIAVLILFCTVLLFVGVLAINKWQMNTTVGVGLFSLYGVYVIYTIVSATSSGKKCGD
jgi:Ca2+/Na+ antiporter